MKNKKTQNIDLLNHWIQISFAWMSLNYNSTQKLICAKANSSLNVITFMEKKVSFSLIVISKIY